MCRPGYGLQFRHHELPDVGTLSPDTRAGVGVAPAHQAFASLANRDFRIYVLGATAAMMADNIEHVISYKVMFDRFHSPALGGFAVISHWMPYLLLAGFTGALADRFDIRRLIQIGMLLFMGVSVTWGVLFATGSLSLPMAMLLLVVHGLAGVIWMPAAQVLIHQMVGPDQLSSAVRLNATGRYLGFLVGPLLGAALLLGLGPSWGIFVNALIYTPLLIWLVNAPYGAAAKGRAHPRPGIGSLTDFGSTLRVVRGSRVLLSMMVLVGAASFFVGNAYQAQMPGFASDLGHGRPDITSACCSAPMPPGVCSAAWSSKPAAGSRRALARPMYWRSFGAPPCAASRARAATRLRSRCSSSRASSSSRSTPWLRRWCRSTLPRRSAAG